jgi:hypothetical protein
MQENNEDIFDPKIAFIKWLYEIVSESGSEELEIVSEEFKALDVRIDAFFSDPDDEDMLIIISDYYLKPTNNFEIDESIYVKKIRMVTNFLQKVYDRKYKEFGTSSMTYEIADQISNSNKNIVINYYTNMIVPSSIQEESMIDVKDRSVIIRYIDLNEIETYLSNRNKTVNVTFSDIIDKQIDAIHVNSTKDFDVYLFAMPGYLLAKLYDKHGLSLLDSNVRSYLKRTQKVNKGIFQTISESPSEFLPYNNGLATVAVGGNIEKIKDNYCAIRSLDDWQIVNGGQTTATLHEALKDRLELSEVLIPVKLTVIKNIESNFDLIQSISLYANTQTAINKSDLSSNEPYYIELDRISRKLLWNNEFHWFFERNRGQYLAYKRRSRNPKKFEKDNPPKYKFTKTDIAKSVVSWQGLPHIVALGREKNFVFFNDHIRHQLIKIDQNYYKSIVGSVILFREIDKIVRKQKLEFKANVVSYTIAKISYELDQHLDLIKIWDQQGLSQELIEAIYKTTIRVRDRLIDSPPNYKNIPMWARKEECWDSVKYLKIPYWDHLKSMNKIDFFPINEAELFIKDNNNFNDATTWSKLNLWNTQVNLFSNKQIGFLKRIETSIIFQKPMTERQKKYAIDIFLLAVKNNYSYKGEI